VYSLIDYSAAVEGSRELEHPSPQATPGDEDEDEDDEESESSEFGDDAEVYRCQWRSSAAHGSFCNRLFATLDVRHILYTFFDALLTVILQELRAHMSSERGHLHSSPDIDGLD
jgi:hypothetical protein